MQCERHPWITLQGSHYGTQYCPECAHEEELAENAREANETSRLLLESQVQFHESLREVAIAAKESMKKRDELACMRVGLPEFDDAFQDKWARVNEDLSAIIQEMRKELEQMRVLKDRFEGAYQELVDSFCEVVLEKNLSRYIDPSPLSGNSEELHTLLLNQPYDNPSNPSSNVACEVGNVLASIYLESDELTEDFKKPSAAAFLTPALILLCLGGMCACVGAHGPVPKGSLYLGLGGLGLYLILLFLRSVRQMSREGRRSELDSYLFRLQAALDIGGNLPGNLTEKSYRLIQCFGKEMMPVYAEALRGRGNTSAQEYFTLEQELTQLMSAMSEQEETATTLKTQHDYMEQEIMSVGKAIHEGKRVKSRILRLTKCPTCAGPLSSRTQVCPYCGSSFR